MIVDEKQLRFYEQNGFCVIKNILTDKEICEYFDLAETMNHESGGSYLPLLNPDRTNSGFRDLLCHPKIIQALESIQKSKISALQSMVYFKKPGSGGRDLHQDNYYTQAETGATIGVWLALEDADQENGGLVAYPGSHREGNLEVIEDTAAKAVEGPLQNERGAACVVPEKYKKTYLDIPRGAIVFIHGQLVHGSDANKSQTRFRRAFVAHYIKKGFAFIPGRNAKREEIDVYAHHTQKSNEAGNAK